MKRRERRMTAAEFFGGTVEKKVARPRSRKPAADDVFADIKVRMVMRIYGVTRRKAEKIIAAHMRDDEAGEGAAGAPDASGLADSAENLLVSEDAGKSLDELIGL